MGIRSGLIQNRITQAGSRTRQPFFLKQNRATSGDQRAKFFSPKLVIGQQNDKYEKEADSMASHVVNTLNNATSPAVQRKCEHCEEEEKLQRQKEEEEEKIQMKGLEEPMVQRKSETEEEEKDIQLKSLEEEEELSVQKKESSLEEEEVQMKSDDNPPATTRSLDTQLANSAGNGRTLPPQTRRQMEYSFGADFSHVNIHTDSTAVQMSKDLHAQAFTHGSDIYFNRGKYDPGSSTGKHLLAHELTHVVQQGDTNRIPSRMVQRQEIELDECPPGYTICDFIREGITMEAQYALTHLYRQGGEDCKIALSIFGGVQNGELKGVFIEDQAAPALMAQRNGSGWWLLIPEGQEAIVSEVESPPMMVVKKRIAEDRVALAAAMKKAWQESSLGAQTIAPPPPSLTPCAPAPTDEYVELPEDTIPGDKCLPPRCDPSIPATVYAQCGFNKLGVPIECLPSPVAGDICGVCEGTSQKSKECLEQNEKTHKQERKRCKDDYSPGKVFKYTAECVKAMAECYADKPGPGKAQACIDVAKCFVDPEPVKEYQECLNRESKRYIERGKECKSLP
jgi:hypothetical protein